jgi:hypothetical protein
MPQRIRTIKPEFFQHEGMYDLETATGLPVRLAFVGLLTCCDREGRFKWRPRNLKTDILPYDAVDFSAVMEALETGGFIERYSVNGESYGRVPTFLRHQVINVREAQSRIPQPPELDQSDASVSISVREGPTDGRCMHVQTRGELDLEEELIRERKGTGTSVVPEKTFDDVSQKAFNTEQFISDLRKIWLRPDFGYSSEHAAMEALQADAKETGLSMAHAAKALLARVQEIASFTDRWPRDRKHLIPGLTNLLRNRTYKQDDCFWEHHDGKQTKRDEREQALERIAHNVVAQTAEEDCGSVEKL